MQRHVAGWLIWWIALFWLWMLVAGDWNLIEWVAAASAAAVGATIAEVARSAAERWCAGWSVISAVVGGGPAGAFWLAAAASVSGCGWCARRVSSAARPYAPSDR